jgi:hypothetical protein
MRLFYRGKDGGPESTVWGFWLIEWKRLFSVVLLCFEDGTRDVYHSHAFSTVSWVLKGRLQEEVVRTQQQIEEGRPPERFTYRPSWRPIWTPLSRFHQVRSVGRSWVISFRGPWRDVWCELLPGIGYRMLTHGRRIVK